MDALARLSAATAALAEAKTLDDVKQIMDIAEAARTYARAAKLGLEAANHAAEVKLRAERKAGELLGQLKRAPAGRPAENTRQPVGNFSEYRQTLEETSVEERTAQRWQTVATVPAEVKLRAERKAGELLGRLEKGDHGGDRRSSSYQAGNLNEYRTVLTENEIATTTAHRWQTVARALRN